MSNLDNCVFCRIAAGAEPCHVVYEDERHLGFLDIFPNTEGFSVVITKEHFPSDVSRAGSQVAADLFEAARNVAAKIAHAYDDVDRCAIVFEGMMIDHLHAKVIPLHRTAGLQPSPESGTTARGDRYFEAYPGYVTTEIAASRANDEHLAAVAAKVNSQGRR
ncbi:MAG: HIT family protein [Acidimicrobiales bacterium]|nr:HIT family protein [Acidimicrobiales bacterium]MXX42663.1 HIT family protein [Acidimicrobiales bacterium]MXZ14493.1 HIT family protein [Acidimicrobiales bacterium]MYA26555.1 HIT family protein [Acidimicrobiales bacterium]MYA81949.1 HIT family protein [Acidimicrobiales bacterium]